MNAIHNYLPVNNPNIAVKLGGNASTNIFGEFVATPMDEKYFFEPKIAEVQSKDMYLSNFSMRISEGKFSRDVVFNNLGDQGLDYFGSCFILQGEFTSQRKQNPNKIVSFSGSQNFKYDPNNEYIHSSKANDPFHIVHFSVCPKYFFQFLPENEHWPEELVNKISKRDSLMGDRYAPITLAQERALQNIIDCPLTGKLGQWMIETSIAQIIVLQLSAIFQNGFLTEPTSIAKRDVDTIQSLKEHLSKTFLQDHSLEDLARNFGTNTSKLMSLFKSAFGKSIFEFIGELKMEHAWHLLKNENWRVVEVAREVGYKNPNHFSTAFKRRFGISPSQL